MKKGFLSQSGSLQTKNKRSVNNKDTSNIPGKEEITQTSTIKLPNSLSKKQINSDNNSNARKNLLSSIFCSGCNIDHSSRNHATNDKSVYCVVCDDSVSPKKLVKLKENKLRKDNILKTYFTASNYSHNMTQQSICTFLRESVTHIFDNNMKYFENHPSLQYSKQSHQKSSFNMLIESDDSFTDTLFPGMSKPAGTNKSDVHSSLSSANRDVDDLNYLPTNLNELFYWHLFKLDYERVIESSYNVLEGVKRRGDGTGNKMDAQTELILIPSITLEALGREVIDTVSRLSRAVSAMQVKSAPTLAHPPTDDQVFYGQLHEDDIKRMVRYPLSNQPNISCNSSAPTSSSLSFCVHNHFLGDEWCELVYRDAIRFVENEQMSEMKTWLTDPRDTSSDTSGTSRHATGGSDSDGPSTDVLSKMNEKVYKQHEWQSSAVSRSMAGAMPLMGWVDVGADTCLLEELYPALAEAVLQLHMLQFIINGMYYVTGHYVGINIVIMFESSLL